MDLSIGIVTYNGQRLLESCLASIEQHRPTCSFEIIVVDNASVDGTPTWLAEHHPGIRLIINERNRGVAAGNNQCLRASSGRYVLLLNNDTLVHARALDRLFAFAEVHADAGAVGGKLMNPDGSFQSSYYDFPTLGSEFLHATRLWVLWDRNYPSHGDEQHISKVDWISSACLLLRKAAADQVGGVYEDYFMYSDETDLQYRIQQAGWRVYYLPQVLTTHFGGQSASHWRRRRLIYRGKLLFFSRNYGLGKTMLLRAIFLVASLLKIVAWAALWVLRRWRQRAVHEIEANYAVIRLSLSLEKRGGAQA